jgi:hypothetical protein
MHARRSDEEAKAPLIPKPLIQPAKKTTSAAELKSEIDAWINFPQFAEECRQAEEKEKRAEERRLAREAKLAARTSAPPFVHPS